MEERWPKVDEKVEGNGFLYMLRWVANAVSRNLFVFPLSISEGKNNLAAKGALIACQTVVHLAVLLCGQRSWVSDDPALSEINPIRQKEKEEEDDNNIFLPGMVEE